LLRAVAMTLMLTPNENKKKNRCYLMWPSVILKANPDQDSHKKFQDVLCFW
jgi:hypothetical protein